MAGRIIRSKIKQKATGDYYRSVVIVGEDDTNEVNTVDVSLSGESGEPIPSPANMVLSFKTKKSNGNKRYVYNDLTFSESAVNFTYVMTSTMKDVNNNQVGDKFISEITVEDNGEVRLRSIVIRQLDATNFLVKVVVVADSEDEIARVDVEVVDLIGNPAQPESISMTNPIVNGDKKVFKMNTLTFEDPAGAADQPYEVIVSLYDESNNLIGSEASEQYVEGLDV